MCHPALIYKYLKYFALMPEIALIDEGNVGISFCNWVIKICSVVMHIGSSERRKETW